MGPAASLRELAARFTDTGHDCLPLVDRAGRLGGVVAAHALRQAIASLDALAGAVVASDLAEPVPTLCPSETLQSAMHKMVVQAHKELPVVSEHDPGEVVAMLSRRMLVATYDHHIQAYLSDSEPAATSARRAGRPPSCASGNPGRTRSGASHRRRAPGRRPQRRHRADPRTDSGHHEADARAGGARRALTRGTRVPTVRAWP